MLLVLEDLHWADELTLRLLAYLARRVPTERLLVVMTAREEELDDAMLLRHTLADLARAGHVVTLGLTPLSRGDTAALVTMLTPVIFSDTGRAARRADLDAPARATRWWPWR